jgi:DNA polymerase III epsilon subunit-like protein
MNQDHIFFDVETSSLDPKSGEIIDIAAIRTDRTGTVLASCSDRIQPRKPVDESCAKVNGYKPEDWASACTFKVAMNTLRKVVLAQHFQEKFVVVAHFADFDRMFLTACCEREQEPVPFEGRAWLDTAQISWPLIAGNMIPSRSLEALTKYYGIENSAAHTAIGDARAVMGVYWEMIRRFGTSLKLEEYARKKGGPTVEMVRRLLNV